MEPQRHAAARDTTVTNPGAGGGVRQQGGRLDADRGGRATWQVTSYVANYELGDRLLTHSSYTTPRDTTRNGLAKLWR